MDKEEIKTVRRCMNFKLIKCENKICVNESCPLNKIYDKEKTKKC